MYEIFAELLRRKGINVAEVSKATGIHPSTFSDWKSGKSRPKQDKLIKIAAYFNVTVDYLINREENRHDKSTVSIDRETYDIIFNSIYSKSLTLLFPARNAEISICIGCIISTQFFLLCA